MKKKIALTIILILSLIFAFVACSENNGSAIDSADSIGDSASDSSTSGESSQQSGGSSGGDSSGNEGGQGGGEQDNPLSEYEPKLYVEDGKDFVILNLTDFQLHDGKSTVTSFAIIDELVERVKPDLITVLGDTAEDDGTYGTKVNFKAIVDHIDALNIPWAPVYGNHDNDDYREPNSVKDVTSDWINDVFLSAKNCLFKVGPDDVNGNGNYIVEVINKSTNKIVKSLFFFDTGTHGVDSTHVSFYEDAVSYSIELNGGDTPESICFMHIPLPEYKIVYSSGEYTGAANEGPSVGSGTTEFFAKIKELGSTTHVICGHDHINSFYGEYQGVYLMYCIKSSDGDYFYQHLLGGTSFTIGAETSFEYHYIDVYFEIITASGVPFREYLSGWKFSDASLLVDIRPTDTVTGSNVVKLTLCGDNVRRENATEKERNGSWNRLSEVIELDLSAMTASCGTFTAGDNGWYTYKLPLSDVALNTTGGEVAYGDETLKMMYFKTVGHSFEYKNIRYEHTEITETDQKDLDGSIIESIPDQNFIGYALYPEIVVKYGDKTLVFGEDYIVKYLNNNAKGIATVKVFPSGIGAHRWKGEKTATFNITEPDYVIRGETFKSEDNYKVDVPPDNYSTVTFDYRIISGSGFGVALIDEDWSKDYFGYLKFDRNGAAEAYAGVSCNKGEDGYVSVTIKMSELTKAVGSPANKTIRTFYISSRQGDAVGFIDNLSFNK